MNQKVINVSLQEANLKRKIRRHLRRVGFQKRNDGTLSISGNGKEVIRTLHGYRKRCPSGLSKSRGGWNEAVNGEG